MTRPWPASWQDTTKRGSPLYDSVRSGHLPDRIPASLEAAPALLSGSGAPVWNVWNDVLFLRNAIRSRYDIPYHPMEDNCFANQLPGQTAGQLFRIKARAGAVPGHCPFTVADRCFLRGLGGCLRRRYPSHPGASGRRGIGTRRRPGPATGAGVCCGTRRRTCHCRCPSEHSRPAAGSGPGTRRHRSPQSHLRSGSGADCGAWSQSGPRDDGETRGIER